MIKLRCPDLRLGELDHELGNLMVDVHHLEDGRAVIRDRHIPVRGHHQLIQALSKMIIVKYLQNEKLMNKTNLFTQNIFLC
jgi:hypothetical protein